MIPHTVEHVDHGVSEILSIALVSGFANEITKPTDNRGIRCKTL